MPYLNHPLSEDGRRVFFSSKEALVPQDTNGAYDAYQYDSESGKIRLLSSGASSEDSYFLDAGTSGDDVFFATKEQLVGWDVDNAYDLYDARVGGGFAEPAAVPAICEGEGCMGPAAVQPGGLKPPSASFRGRGNVKKCPKGKRKVHRKGKVRCVKKHKKHPHKHRTHNHRR